MSYTILDKNGEEVRIPASVRERLSPKLLMYQELYLGSKKVRILPDRNHVTLQIFNEKGRLISDNEYSWLWWLKNDYQYVRIVNWMMDNDYILVSNEYKVK